MNAPSRSPRLRRRCALRAALLAIAIPAGCAAPFNTNYLSGSRRLDASPTSAAATAANDPVVAANDPKAISLRKAMGEEPKTPDEALAGVIDQLQQMDAI